MVIFGAGASYDSSSSRPAANHSRKVNDEPDLRYRPPLADELFDDVMLSIGNITAFAQCLPVLPYLQHRAGKSVEAVLEHLRQEEDGYERRSKQLAAIRYYLKHMLEECEKQWKQSVMRGISNYKTLLDQSEYWSRNHRRPCLVTFNYDTLIEDALSSVGITIKKIEDYIGSSDYSLIKLHGSINWGRRVDIPVLSHDVNSTSIISQLIDAVPHIRLSEQIFLERPASRNLRMGQPRSHHEETILFPALAIPVVTKKSFECPESHLDFLREVIPKVRKLLIVGWRGAEAHFVDMLKEGLSHDVRVMVVAGSSKDATDVIDRLNGAGVLGEFKATNGGFTDFVARRELDTFLAE